MTYEDFEKAKLIQHKVGVASGNLVTLRHIADIALKYPLLQRSYKIKVNDDPSLEMIVDPEFIGMAIEYYEQEIETLNEQFAALGKESNK